MADLYRHADLPRRRSRQGHRRRANMPANSTLAGLAHGSVVDSDHRQGPHHAHRHERGAARRRRARRADAREPPADGRTPTQPTRTMSRRTARRSGRCTTTRSCSTASRSRWWWPRAGRWRALRRRWCGSNTSRSARHRLCERERRHGQAIRRSSTPPKPRGMPSRRLRQPTCATRPSISFRSSITTRWSCLPRR